MGSVFCICCMSLVCAWWRLSYESVYVCICASVSVCLSLTKNFSLYVLNNTGSITQGRNVRLTDIFNRNVQGIEPLTLSDSDNNHHSWSTNMHKCAHHLWWIFTEKFLFNLCDGCVQQMEHIRGSRSGQGSNSLDSESFSHGKRKASEFGGYIVLWKAG